VAEAAGQVVGFSFLREYNAVRAVGPIGVDPKVQGAGIGRALMLAMIERARGQPGIRLHQDAFNPASLSLYASVGFEVKEPMALVSGLPKSPPDPGVEIRVMRPEDVAACEALCASIYGFARHEIHDRPKRFQPIVAVRDGRIVAYASVAGLGMGGHGVAESEADMQALLLGIGARSSQRLEFLLPMRNTRFFRWALAEGFRVVKVMNLMTYGEYQEPRGTYFPSVAY
jgi:hypothetical protein